MWETRDGSETQPIRSPQIRAQASQSLCTTWPGLWLQAEVLVTMTWRKFHWKKTKIINWNVKPPKTPKSKTKPSIKPTYLSSIALPYRPSSRIWLKHTPKVFLNYCKPYRFTTRTLSNNQFLSTVHSQLVTVHHLSSKITITYSKSQSSRTLISTWASMTALCHPRLSGNPSWSRSHLWCPPTRPTRTLIRTQAISKATGLSRAACQPSKAVSSEWSLLKTTQTCALTSHHPRSWLSTASHSHSSTTWPARICQWLRCTEDRRSWERSKSGSRTRTGR